MSQWLRLRSVITAGHNIALWDGIQYGNTLWRPESKSYKLLDKQYWSKAMVDGFWSNLQESSKIWSMVYPCSIKLSCQTETLFLEPLISMFCCYTGFLLACDLWRMTKNSVFPSYRPANLSKKINSQTEPKWNQTGQFPKNAGIGVRQYIGQGILLITESM